MFTARYANKSIDQSIHTPIQISLGYPKFKLDYNMRGIADLIMPTYDILKIENENEYRERYYERLGLTGCPQRIYIQLKRLSEPGKQIVLLCFEDIRKPGEWCHRRMFADWWKQRTGIDISELEEMEPEKYTPEERRAMVDAQYDGNLFE